MLYLWRKIIVRVSKTLFCVVNDRWVAALSFRQKKGNKNKEKDKHTNSNSENNLLLFLIWGLERAQQNEHEDIRNQRTCIWTLEWFWCYRVQLTPPYLRWLENCTTEGFNGERWWVGSACPGYVVVVLLLNVHGQQLRSCWDGQLT